jgi:plasmid stabilization system protein ParE
VRLAWTPEARSDRDAIYTYIESENARAALNLDGRFATLAATLVTHPMMGRPGRVANTFFAFFIPPDNGPSKAPESQRSQWMRNTAPES